MGLTMTLVLPAWVAEEAMLSWIRRDPVKLLFCASKVLLAKPAIAVPDLRLEVELTSKSY